MEYRIHFNRPSFTGSEYEYIRQAIEFGQISGDGLFTKRCHALLEQLLGVDKVLLTTSGTHALEMAALLLEIQPGDEVIVPSFTFVSTINAFLLRGAKPVFCDIRPDTLNINEALIPDLITPKTKAVVPVHYAGIGCEMNVICEIAESSGISVVEDNAHGLFGKYRGRLLGTFGRLACQSFHETKNFSCGEGGALIINDPSLAERAEIIREKGTNRSKFFRGEIAKYCWVDIGSSYLPSDILAALLFSQLEARESIQSARKHIWTRYWTELSGWAGDNGATLPVIPDYCEQPYHMFYMLMPSLDARQGLISHLKSKGILSVFHYLPLHLYGKGKEYGGRKGDCPVTEDISDRLIRLPFYNTLTEEDQSLVISSIKEYRTA